MMNDKQMDFDRALHALMVEVSHLEALVNHLDLSDRLVLEACSARINQLILKKWSSSLRLSR
jgi:hypothetical protein